MLAWYAYTIKAGVTAYAYGIPQEISGQLWMLDPLAVVRPGRSPGTWEACCQDRGQGARSLVGAKRLAEEMAAATLARMRLRIGRSAAAATRRGHP